MRNEELVARVNALSDGLEDVTAELKVLRAEVSDLKKKLIKPEI